MKRVSLIISFLLVSGWAISQGNKKYDTQVIKAESAYDIGNYWTAIKVNEKLGKKAIKKEGPESYYAGVYYILRGKYNLAVGMLNGFESSLEKGLEIALKNKGSDPTNYVNQLLTVTELYIRFGNFLKADNLLESARKELTDADRMTENFKAGMNVFQAEIQAGMGYYNKAMEFIVNSEDYFQGRAVDKETYVDPKSGKLRTERLSPNVVDERYSDYASILTLKANVLRKQGSIIEADNAFGFAENWIQGKLGKGHIKYVQNQVLWTEMLEENGTQDLPEANYRQALNLVKREHVESHYTAQALYEHLLRNYLMDGKEAKYRSLRTEYEHVIKKYFDKGSMYYVNLNTLNFDVSVYRERTSGLEDQAAKILAGTAIPEFHPKRISLLEFLHSIAVGNKKYKNGESYLNEILTIKKELYGANSPEYHLSRIDLANHYLDYTDNFKEAEEIYNTSFIEVIEKEISSGHIKYVEILNHLASFYEANDRYDLASQTLDKALLATRAKYDNRDVNFGVELEKIANLQISIGEYDKANENLTTALDILAKERKDEYDVVYYIKALETSARYKALMGMFDEAEADLIQSIKLKSRARATIDFDEVAANEGLASMYMDLGRYRSSEELLTSVIASKSALFGSSSRRLISPLTDRGRLFLINGDYTNADKTARRANSLGVQSYGENSTKIANSLLLISDVSYSIGDYEQAEANVLKAIEIQKKQFGEEHIDVAKSLSRLALIKFYKRDNPKEVEKLFQSARTILENKLGNRNPQYAELLKNTAIMYIATKQFDNAFNSLGLAETIWLNKAGRRNNINAASIYMLLGDIHYEQKNYKEANLQYEKAKKLYEKFFSRTHPEYVKVLSRLSKVYYMEDDLSRAKQALDQTIKTYNDFIKTYFPALSEREKAKFWNTIKYDYEFYNTLVLRMGERNPEMVRQMFNNALGTKALLLNTSLKIKERINTSTDSTLIRTYNIWSEKKDILTNTLSMSNEELLQNEIDAAKLSQEVEDLERQLSERSELFSSNLEEKQVTWEDVRKVLGPNEVAVEMVRFRLFDHTFTDSVLYASLYLKNLETQPGPLMLLMKEGKEMETSYFKFYRNSIRFRISDPYSYRVYWKPLEDRIGGNATVYLSADGVYNQINLEAIPTSDGKYVIDNSNIILVSNTKDIYFNKIKYRTVQEENLASMFGNPKYYLASAGQQKFGQLPGTEKEIEELKSLLEKSGWNASEYLGSDATEPQVKQINNPKVFHIATHGFFTPSTEITENDQGLNQNESELFNNPLLRTGLMLRGAGDLLNKTAFNYNIEEGILTAYEAMNLNLEKTDLVVLSACETGLGDLEFGEGVYGLQRAFIVAGARTLIMSMFKVNDEATQKLMVNFYNKWLQTGKKRESFVAAKKELRNEYQDPIFWGAFIMIGLD
ncbi:MAG TPA: CHAT domain-containing protein [Cyclobacteriaceae bacterium]|jgi:CHAT domain-containing protein